MTPANSTMTPRRFPLAIHRSRLAGGMLFGLMLTGCATTQPTVSDAPPQDVQYALERGDCRAAYNALDAAGAPASVDTRLTVARVCLQRGEFARTRNLTDAIGQSHPDHPDIDYAAYLGALAQLGTWNRAAAAPPKQRSEQGRQVFRELAAFLNDYPMSEYTESIAPRLARLRETLADIELQIADQAAESGRAEEAQARLQYVRDYYPGTPAGRKAADRLAAPNDQQTRSD
ncbi:MAG: outer membrane protein assembly factor BamD [Thioalkalivibrio sp.]